MRPTSSTAGARLTDGVCSSGTGRGFASSPLFHIERPQRVDDESRLHENAKEGIRLRDRASEATAFSVPPRQYIAHFRISLCMCTALQQTLTRLAPARLLPAQGRKPRPPSRAQSRLHEAPRCPAQSAPSETLLVHLRMARQPDHSSAIPRFEAIRIVSRGKKALVRRKSHAAYML